MKCFVVLILSLILVLSETGALFFDNKKRENESSSRKIYINV